MPLRDTVRPLLLAPLAAVLVLAGFGLAPGRGLAGLAFLAAMVWGCALAAAVVLVLPIFMLAPSLRQPSVWIAVPWGAVAAWFAGAAIVGTSHLLLPFTIAGASSGLLYAITVASHPGARPGGQR